MPAEDTEEIAIVGIGCRFPGADNINEFWKVLVKGENHVREIPRDRWDHDKFYSENEDEPGKIYVRKAGLLSDHAKWDNRLFGISENEAVRIDPQQRYVLECTHMALEDGGFTRKQLYGSKTGVFIGVMNDDYKSLIGTDHQEDTNFTATGLSTTVIASRVSYVYNLQGPCMTIDTACSSAMMALHLGCQAIRSGDCDMAICGGVSSILSPDVFVPLCKARMLSKTGQCQTFCDTADGYARGEGCGIVILQSTKKAATNVNNIWGILETAINQDGRAATPMTAPSSDQQLALLQTIYKKLKMHPTDLDYIEVHGTGTPVGDPTEVNTFAALFNKFNKNSIKTEVSNNAKKILMGSVKTNIGHTESAAAVAGLIKVLLMMKHERFVRSLHLHEDKSNLSKRINLENTALDVSLKVANWPTNQFGNRIACVNSFGFGGSNGHAIVKQVSDGTMRAENEKASVVSKSDDLPYFVCLFGRDKEALSNNIRHFVIDMETCSETLSDVSYTSMFCRDHFERRTLLFGQTLTDINVHAERKKESMENISLGKKRNIVMVFCGVGTAWYGMGTEMMKTHSVFRQTVRQIDKYMKSNFNFNVEEKLLGKTDYSDPFLNHIAIFTIQVALFELWKCLGVLPDAIVGQSVGEVAAAYASNALSLPSAIDVIYHRSRILSQQTGGKMTVIGNIPITEIEETCSKYKGSLNIAVYNSPMSCTISGAADGIENIEKEFGTHSGSFIRSLNVARAYHSHLMDSCLPEITSKLKEIESGEEKGIPQVSTVTGELSDQKEFTSSKYWAENVRKPVLFMQAIRKTVEYGSTNVYIEIGPRQVLKLHLPNILLEGTKSICLPSMNQSDEKSFYRTLSTLFELGVEIDLRKLVPFRGQLSQLPRYHFNKSNHIFISPTTKQYLAGFTTSRGSQHWVEKVTDEDFTLLVSQKTTPFVFDHHLFGSVTVPGAIYAEAAFTGACEILESQENALELSVNFENPCMIEKNQATLLNLSFQHNTVTEKSMEFSVYLEERILSNGTVAIRTSSVYHDIDVMALKRRLTKHKRSDEIYAVLQKIGLTYGDSLRLIDNIYHNASECLAVISLPAKVKCNIRNFCLHPAILDAMFQTSAIQSTVTGISNEGVPKGFKSLTIESAPKEKMLVHTKLITRTRINSFYKSTLCSRNGAVIAELNGMVIRSIHSTIPNDSISYELHWRKFEWVNKFEESSNMSNNLPLIVFGSDRLRRWLSRVNYSHAFTEITNNPDDFKHLVAETLRHSVKGQKILFGPCWNCQDIEDPDTKNAYDLVKTNAILLQTILTVKNSMSDYVCPIYIVTENTQRLASQNHRNSNYIGAELWGFARSAMTEMPLEDIRLIDVELEYENIHTLFSIVNDTDTKFTEYLIRNGCIYVSELRPSSTQDIAYKHAGKINSSEHLHLYSVSSGTVSEPFLADANCGFELTDLHCPRDNLANILLATAHLQCSYNSQDLSLRTSGCDDQDSIGAQIKVTEFTGWCMKETGSDSEEKYGVCFPITVSTVVVVPRCCIFPLTDIPFYIPGLVSEVVLLWKVSKQIKASSNVLIVMSDKKCWRATVLLDILQYRKSEGTAVSWSKVKEMAITHKRFTHCIALQVENACDLNLLNGIIDIQLVIFMDRWLPWDPKFDTTQCKRYFKTVLLRSADILSEDILIKVVPKVLKYLLNTTADFQRILHEEMHVTPKVDSGPELPYHSILIQTTPGETNLPIMQYPSSLFKKDGYYVFIGGTSGLGWELLQYCAQLGAGNIITISRRALSVEKRAEMKRIEMLHRCSIKHLQGDVTDLESIQCAFKTLKNNKHRVKGIFHGGGVLNDTLLKNMSVEQLETALKPKVLGTLNLHKVTKNINLDYFMMHSSIAAIFGNPGQCNYAAGNSFQDSFAYFRESHGYNAQSINWGALPFGMTTKGGADIEKRFLRQGIHMLHRNDVRTCFREEILTKDVQKIFGIFDWNKIIQNPIYASSQKKFAPIIEDLGITQEASSQQSNETTKLSSSFFHQSTEEQKATLLKITLDILKYSLSLEIENIDLNSGLYILGIDSMSAMSISNRLFEMTGARVTVMLLLSNTTTVESLVNLLHCELFTGNVGEKSMNETAFDDNMLETSVPFMQANVLNSLETEKSSNLIRIISYEMTSRRIGVTKWTTIIVKLLQMHPELRQIYDWNVEANRFEAREIDIDETNAPITKVPFNKIFQTLTEVSLDPRKEIPISLELSCKGRKTRMKLFLHAVVVDIQSINIFFRDLELCARHYFFGSPLPVANSINVADTIRQALTSRFGEMKIFWKEIFSHTIEPFTFADALEDKLEEEDWCQIGYVFKEMQFADIEKFRKGENITLYNLILSVYFLVIHESTGLEVIPLTTNTDVRAFVPALENVMSRCINEIPVIGTVKPTMPVKDYLRETAAQLNAMTQHGAYPFDLIKDEMKSDALRTNIKRHKFAIDDVSAASRKSVKKDVTVTINTIRHRRHTYETYLSMYQNPSRNTLCLDLGFNSKAISTSSAKFMLERIGSLLLRLTYGDCFISIKDMCTGNVRELDGVNGSLYYGERLLENILENKVEKSSTEYAKTQPSDYARVLKQEENLKGQETILKGYLTKQSKHGNVYRATVLLQRQDFHDRVGSKAEYYLCWSTWHTEGQINMRDITEIHIKKMSGRYTLLMKNKSNWVQFLAKDLLEAKSWFVQLKDAKEHIHMDDVDEETITRL